MKEYRNKEGQLHRLDGSTVFNKEFKHYFRKGLWHRENGAEMNHSDGDKAWIFNHKTIKRITKNSQKIYG